VPRQLCCRAKRAGVACIKVRDPDEIKRVVETIVASLDEAERQCPG
jgi:hypothetical protein